MDLFRDLDNGSNDLNEICYTDVLGGEISIKLSLRFQKRVLSEQSSVAQIL